MDVRIVLLTFLLGSSILAYAQPPLRFSNLSIEQGLSNENVTCITQDSRGFIWIGTTQGLNRYDAYNFKVYQTNSGKKFSLKSNRILSVFEDSNKTLWVGTDGSGLHFYDSIIDDFRSVVINSPNLRENRIKVIFEDSERNLWLGNLGSLGGIGIYKHNTGEYIPFNYKDTNIASDQPMAKFMNIHAIQQDSKGNLWIATFEDGLFEFNLKTREFISRCNDVPGIARVISLFIDSSDTIWFGTFAGGLVKYNPETKEWKRLLTKERVFSICEDKPGFLWVGTADGLFYHDTRSESFKGTYHQFYDPTSLSHDYVGALFKDKSGVLWAGTQMGGVSLLESPHLKFQTMKMTDPNSRTGLTSSCITALLVDSNSAVWLGTRAGGLLKQTKPSSDLFSSEFLQYKAFSPHARGALNSNVISSLIEDHNGNIWIGHLNHGINVLNPYTGVFESIRKNQNDRNSIIEDRINTLFEDTRGRIWVGTFSGGTTLIDANTKKIIRRIRSLKYSRGIRPRCYLEDSKHNIWIGYDVIAGLDRYDENKNELIHYSIIDSRGNPAFGRNAVSSMFEDNEGRIWLATDNGVFGAVVDRDTTYVPKEELVIVRVFKHFNENNGLASNHVYGMLPDRNNKIWVSTSRGLSCIDPEKNVVINYDQLDGLPKGTFNVGSQTSKDGLMFFGGVNGLALFNPDSIKLNTLPPPVYITDLQIQNKSISTNNDTTNTRDFYLDKALEYIREVTLPYDQNSVTFEFAALSYFGSKKNHYSYMLENFDKEWNHVGTHRSATYTNLDPGEYNFRVKASNNDGIWNTDGASMRITILPPPWKTWWAYTAYAIAVIALIVLGRNEIIKREQLKATAKLKEVEAEKYHELDIMKSRFFANISHEFRTPLTLLLGPIERRISTASDKADKNELATMHRNANRLLTLVNQLLDLSRLESGSLKLKCQWANLNEAVSFFSSQFASMADSRNIKFTIEFQQRVDLFFDFEKLEKIVTNLLGNAFKFTQQHGTITVTVNSLGPSNEFINGAASITISDSGIGINPSELPRIFDRFYQVDSSATRQYEGSGIGLALVKELVDLHHGTVSVVSIPGQGTTFTVRLPLGKEHLSADEISSDTTDINSERTVLEAEEMMDGKEVVLDQSTLPKVLVVEDNADLRHYLRSSLSDKYNILEAIDGADGLTKATDQVPDLIISDLMMPVMDGIQLTLKLKRDEKTSHIPIILLTAKAEVLTKLEGLRTGADDYMTKPFSQEELSTRIHNLITIRRNLQKKYSSQLQLMPSQIVVDSMEDRFVKKVMTIIEQHIDDPSFSVEALAEEAAMSNTQLYRKLKQVTGFTPNEVIRNTRLERAAALLRQRAGNVADIAYQVGFNNLSYFSKCFKEKFGTSPSEFTILKSDSD